MTLDEDQIEPLISEARAAFTGFSDWHWNNEKDEAYDGFAVWGKFCHAESDGAEAIFFVTFDLHPAGWVGHLTTGQPTFYWSSADMGDAILLTTIPVATLIEATRVLKARMRTLSATLTGEMAIETI